MSVCFGGKGREMLEVCLFEWLPCVCACGECWRLLVLGVKDSKEKVICQ